VRPSRGRHHRRCGHDLTCAPAGAWCNQTLSMVPCLPGSAVTRVCRALFCGVLFSGGEASSRFAQRHRQTQCVHRA
jgi:hypothetical protein